MVERSAVNRLVAGSNPAWGVPNLSDRCQAIVWDALQDSTTLPELAQSLAQSHALAQVQRVHLWLIPWSEIPLELAQAWVSISEQNQSQTFPSPQSQSWQQRRAALRWVLSQYLGVSPQALQFDYGANGKPEIQSPSLSPPLRFSWTHSGSQALAALTLDTPLGVDMEQIQPRPHAFQIAQRYLTRTQQGNLAQLSEPEFTQEFLHLWTGLEAAIKAVGGSVFTQAWNHAQLQQQPQQTDSFRIEPDFIGSLMVLTAKPLEIQVFKLDCLPPP